MLLATILFLTQAKPLDVNQKISLEIRGGTGIEVAKALANATGIAFATTDAATFERYVIHVENQPLHDVMERIADAEHGQWMRADNGFELRRSPERVAATLAAHHADIVRMFTKALDEYHKQLGAKPDFSDEAAKNLAGEWRRLGPMPTNGNFNNNYWEVQNRLQRRLPVGRAMMRIMLGFTPEQLTELSYETPTVFSTQPTAMQHELPEAASTALSNMMEEQSTWEEAVAKYLPDRGDESWDGMAMQGKINRVTTVILTLQKWDESSGIQAEMKMADKKGRIITQANLFIQPEMSDNQQFNTANQRQEPKIKLPAVDVTLAGKFGWNWERRGDSSKQVPLTGEARAIVSNPEKVDPLASFASDAIFALARAHHENVCAVIDDRTVPAIASFISKAGLDPKIANILGAWGMQSVTEGSGWLVLAEQRPDRADEVRCDRIVLHRMLDAAVANGRLTLDDAAEYALEQPHFYENPMAQAYLSALINNEAGQVLEQSDRNLLRFYGSLDSNQRKDSQHIPLGSLTELQTGLLEKILYGNNSNLQLAQEAQTAPQQPDENGEYENFWNTLEREPTYSLGNGIPHTGYLVMTTTKDRAVAAHMQYASWDQGVQTYDLRQLAYTLVSRPNPWQGEDQQWKVLGMRAANRTLVTFEFKYTDRLSQDLSLQDVVPTSKETMTVDSLPDDVRQDLNKFMAEAKKQYAEQQQYFAGGNGGVYYGGQSRSGPP